MPVHFAAARSAAHSPIARALARKALARAANDNGEGARLGAVRGNVVAVVPANAQHVQVLAALGGVLLKLTGGVDVAHLCKVLLVAIAHLHGGVFKEF